MRIFKKIFIFSLITAFVVMFVTQMLLKNSAIKNKLSILYDMEAQYVYSEKDFSDGYMKIDISNPSDNLFLLQNGEKIAILNKESIEIKVCDNSVIEVDGRDMDVACTVKITELSENIHGFYEEKVDIKSNIVILGRFFLK